MLFSRRHRLRFGRYPRSTSEAIPMQSRTRQPGEDLARPQQAGSRLLSPDKVSCVGIPDNVKDWRRDRCGYIKCGLHLTVIITQHHTSSGKKESQLSGRSGLYVVPSSQRNSGGGETVEASNVWSTRRDGT